MLVPWPGGIKSFPPRDHNLSFGRVKESFEAVDIEITFRNRAKGRTVGLEQHEVKQTPKSHSSIRDHKQKPQSWHMKTYIYAALDLKLNYSLFFNDKIKWKPDDASNSNNTINQSIVNDII
jgi:hypothetical protein